MKKGKCENRVPHVSHDLWIPGEGWPENEKAEAELVHCIGVAPTDPDAIVFTEVAEVVPTVTPMGEIEDRVPEHG